MPTLDDHIINDARSRLERYLNGRHDVEAIEYLAAGGSAAVFCVKGTKGEVAYKLFNPSFFEGAQGAAERRRLEVQKRLIGHDCDSLIQTLAVVEAEGTAIVEMEMVRWPCLKNVLSEVPDAAIEGLIQKLVKAVRFLDSKGIVHRDIKPENIHISPDFKQLKLLDLGVAREFETLSQEDISDTDHGHKRPFLATAQYSSPEYLFRLDEPSARLWNGVNFYQVGAVLHDLIMKRPLFEYEVGLNNKWLVARAVLTKTPSLDDGQPSRLASLKAIAAKCLVKDLEARLRLVRWDDFFAEEQLSPLASLKMRLVSSKAQDTEQEARRAQAKLDFERTQCLDRVMSGLRDNLTAACGPQLPLSTKALAPGRQFAIEFQFPIPMRCVFSFEWGSEIYARSAELVASIYLSENAVEIPTSLSTHSLCGISLDDVGEHSIVDVANVIAGFVSSCVSLFETSADLKKLEGLDICASFKSTGVEA